MQFRIVELIKRFLGIRSPSRAWSTHVWDELRIDWKQYPPAPRRPWYAARGPHEPYEWPELKRRARFVRRLIRRHWFTLMFEPRGPIAMSVRAYMEAEPERPKELEPWEVWGAKLLELQKLIDSGVVKLNHEAVEEFARECGVLNDGK